jgi:hypothetical protein
MTRRMSDDKQNLSEYNPVGTPPEGFRPADCCGKCQHYKCWAHYCSKFDFPCNETYVCNGFELISCDKDMYSQSVEPEVPKNPAIPSLYEAALSKAQKLYQTETPKEKLVLSEYEQLYKARYGNLEHCYL